MQILGEKIENYGEMKRFLIDHALLQEEKGAQKLEPIVRQTCRWDAPHLSETAVEVIVSVLYNFINAWSLLFCSLRKMCTGCPTNERLLSYVHFQGLQRFTPGRRGRC